MRILIRRPFIQQNDVPGLGQRQQERHALLLPFRQPQVGDFSVLQLQLVGHLQTLQPCRHQRRIGLLALRPEQAVKQPDVGKHCGKQFAVLLWPLRRQRLAVDEDLTGYWLVQAGQEHRQR